MAGASFSRASRLVTRLASTPPPESGTSSQPHLSQQRARLAWRRASCAAFFATASFTGTSAPLPEYISSGVCPRKAQCGISELWAATYVETWRQTAATLSNVFRNIGLGRRQHGRWKTGLCQPIWSRRFGWLAARLVAETLKDGFGWPPRPSRTVLPWANCRFESEPRRLVRGLDGALVDADVVRLGSLDGTDSRWFEVRVAGPAALLVAKVHKIDDRQGTGRQSDKDALDALRLLRGTDTDDLAARFRSLLDDSKSAEFAEAAVTLLRTQFGTRGGVGIEMATRSAGPLADADELAGSSLALADDLLDALKR
jgi:hypothetical protein